MADEERAKELAQQGVLAKGNVFIKELRRETGSRIGATKEDFAHNLDAAIDEGKIRLSDIEEWVQRVEGWGLQYVYLWRAPRAFARQAVWRDPDAVQEAARVAGLGEVWDAPTAASFPEELTLTHASYASGRLLLQWHEAGTSWIRDPDKDIQPRPEGDDIYRYDAYRLRGERTVMRFEFRPADAVVAAFVPQPVTTGDHAKAQNEMFKAVEKLVPRDRLAAFNVGRASVLSPDGRFEGLEIVPIKLGEGDSVLAVPLMGVRSPVWCPTQSG